MTEQEIYSAMLEKLQEAGLVVDALQIDGQLHRCGTEKTPNGHDGAYIIHLDPPASVWWQNWQTGREGTWCAKDGKRLSEKEREALTQRIAEDRRKAEEDRQKRYVEAAQKAETLWKDATPIEGREYGYLKMKGVQSYGLRVCNGVLTVPVYGENGNLQSLQFIRNDGVKRFLTGGKMSGGFFSIRAKDKSKNGILCLCEGYATAASIHEATGFALLVAFNAGNLLAVAQMARRRYPEREIVLCADYDNPSEQSPQAGGVGVAKATEAARAIGGCLAIPDLDGQKVDFNDLAQARGLEYVRSQIADRKYLSIKRKTLKCLDIEELLTLEIPPRGHILYPVIPEQGLAMLFAARGIGKTWTSLTIAIVVATGTSIFQWEAKKARKVLYIDGEMPLAAIQERVATIVNNLNCDFDKDNFHIITPDVQEDGLIPNLATEEGQAIIKPFVDSVDFIVIDNLATLCRTGKANDEDSWIPVQQWLLQLRRQGKSVLIVHHESKNGSQRGTVAKEDVLDTVVRLKRPADYEEDQGARFEVLLTKARGIFGKQAEPFIAELRDGQWYTQEIEAANLEVVRSLAEDGLTMRDIAKEVGMSLSSVQRLCKKYGVETKGRRKS